MPGSTCRVSSTGRIAEIERTFTGCALHSGHTVVCDDIAANVLVEAGTRTAFRGCSMLTTPLVDDGARGAPRPRLTPRQTRPCASAAGRVPSLAMLSFG